MKKEIMVNNILMHHHDNHITTIKQHLIIVVTHREIAEPNFVQASISCLSNTQTSNIPSHTLWSTLWQSDVSLTHPFTPRRRMCEFTNGMDLRLWGQERTFPAFFSLCSTIYVWKQECTNGQRGGKQRCIVTKFWDISGKLESEGRWEDMSWGTFLWRRTRSS